MRNRLFVSVCAVTASVLLAQTAFANIFFFGDSTTDSGNVYTATFGTYPPAPYYNGRLSNGPVYAERLAPLYGFAPAIPSLLGGNNYAFGGAWTAGGPLVPGVQQQIGMYLAEKTPSSQHLYVLWAGANDLLDGQTDPTIPAANMAANVAALASAGARNFVVLNVPPLDQAPRFSGTPEEPAVAAWVAGYNASLAFGLASLAPSLPAGTTLLPFDTHDLFTDIIANPSSFGLTNVTDPACTTAPLPPIVPNPGEYLFWDTIHPTTAAHQLLATRLAATVPASMVPEPGSLAVISAGLAVLTLCRRRDVLEGRKQAV